MTIPYRECACGKQIKVGGTDTCDYCKNIFSMDVVERLNGYIAYNTGQSREEDDVMRAAVSEIERLRSVLSDIAEHPGTNADEAAHLRADRARHALQPSQ